MVTNQSLRRPIIACTWEPCVQPGTSTRSWNVTATNCSVMRDVKRPCMALNLRDRGPLLQLVSTARIGCGSRSLVVIAAGEASWVPGGPVQFFRPGRHLLDKERGGMARSAAARYTSYIRPG